MKLISKIFGSKKVQLTTTTRGEFRIRDERDATLAQYFTTAEALMSACQDRGQVEEKTNGQWCQPSASFWTVYHAAKGSKNYFA
jgi:hypothetical protein